MLGDQRLLELCGQRTSRLVASDHWVFRCGDNRTQIGQRQFGEIGLGCIGPVEPFGDAQLRKQLLGHLNQTGGWNLFLACGLEAGVLLLNGLTHRRNSTLQGTLGHGALGLWQIGEHRSAVSAAWLEALWLRTLRQLGRSSEVGARTTVACTGFATGASGAITITARTTICTGTGSGTGPSRCRAFATGTTIAIGARWAITFGTACWAVATIAAISTVTAISTIVAATCGELLCDGFKVFAAWQDLEQAALFGLALDGGHAEDSCAIELGFDVGAKDVADLRWAGQYRCVKYTLWLTGSGCSPGPGAVGARAC